LPLRENTDLQPKISTVSLSGGQEVQVTLNPMQLTEDKK
jgi:hypothetical protein